MSIVMLLLKGRMEAMQLHIISQPVKSLLCIHLQEITLSGLKQV